MADPKFMRQQSTGKILPFTKGLLGRPGFVPFYPDSAEAREKAVKAKLGKLGFIDKDGEIDQKKVSNAKLAIEALQELDNLYHELKYVQEQKKKKAEKKEE